MVAIYIDKENEKKSIWVSGISLSVVNNLEKVEDHTYKAILAQKEVEELRLKNAMAEARIENEVNKLALAEQEKLIALNEIERLKYENEALQSAAKEQERFRILVKQMGHDIDSPRTAIDYLVSKLSIKISEADRIILRTASESIAGIAQRLLSQYDGKDLKEDDEVFLVSSVLVQIINEKRVEHRNTGVIFEIENGELANFTFIKHNFSDFKRMISNLVNNAVESLKDVPDGKVKVRLGNNATKAVIFVIDNGSGMPKHIQSKFFKGIAVTEGKERGHGLGLTQVSDVIKAGDGICSIYASENDGTEFKVAFPKVDIPYWIATGIKLTKDDTVIILDDDKSIHEIWNSIFKNVLEKYPTLKIKHFKQGKDVVNYINNLTTEQKQDIFLLTDLELLRQNLSGLDVVEQTGIRRAILVTSYSASLDIQNQVTKAGIKMLPKELASAAKITVDKKLLKWSKKVDMVWVEDSKGFVDGLIKRCYSHLKVDSYYDPIAFMEEVHQYPLNTRIILDTYYKSPGGLYYTTDGFTLAKELHETGYTNLVLYAGEDPRSLAPAYLTVVLKSNFNVIDKLDKV